MPVNFFPSHDPLETSLSQLQHLEYQVKNPLTLNAQLQGGAIAMPTARMADSGTVAFGYSHLPPYRLYTLSLQLFERLELTGNYWLYNGIPEPVFGHLGFGDDAERAANLKFALHPNFAIGWNDFIGTMRMHSTYAVITHSWQNFDVSLGWGRGRIDGLFGSLAWSPTPHLSLIAEYDGNNYAEHPHEHPEGRTTAAHFNAGIQCQLGPHISASASSLRGTTWTASIAAHYNLGYARDLFPKSTTSYHHPIDHEPLGLARSRAEFAHELAYALDEQGFTLQALSLIPDTRDSLRLTLRNPTYRSESTAFQQLTQVLTALTPNKIEIVTAVFEHNGVPTHEYRFRTTDLLRYRDAQIGAPEFAALTPPRPAAAPPSQIAPLFAQPLPRLIFTARPRISTYLGSRTGKTKYALAIAGGPEGSLFDLYYRILASYTLHSSAQDVSAQDRYSPSMLPQVRTDTILYQQAAPFHLEEAFIQHAHNLGHGWLGRLAMGYFELAFGGMAAELMYRPIGQPWTVGFEIAKVWKRRYAGLGFTSTIPRYNGTELTSIPFTGIQYFVDFSAHVYSLDCKLAVGQFLAGDRGARLDVTRLFKSGLRIGFWTTVTDGHDAMGHRPYYDKGISVGLPLDFFLPHPSRNHIGTAMAAWLRDVGARSATGRPM